jgi:hypothetical protein
MPTTSPCSTSNDTSFERPELFREEARLNGTFTKIDNGITECEISFMRSHDRIFLAGIVDADDGRV